MLLVAGSLYNVPPLGYVIDLSAMVKKSWIKSKDYVPPFGHAERLTLKKFAEKMKIDTKAALAELKTNGIVPAGPEATLKEIARENGTSPMALYSVIRKLEPAAPRR